jgi:RNA polymerase sigma factor (sigma-70 family)
MIKRSTVHHCKTGSRRHYSAMPKPDPIRTRPSLLKRIANWQDQASWEDFFNTYRNLVYGVARHAGLNHAEAEDAVQDTMVAVAKHIESFSYNPAIGTFKNWLLTMTRSKIVDQMRRRHDRGRGGEKREIVDYAKLQMSDGRASFDEFWEREWQLALLDIAKKRVKQRDPEKYQIYDLCIAKELDAKKVADLLGIPVKQVHMAKHRVKELVAEELKRLEKADNKPL